MTTSPFGRLWNGEAFQTSLYIGINIENILYGIELLLYLKTIRVVWSNRGARRRSNIFYALFSTMILLMTTVWMAAHMVLGQQMWLLNPDFPGGPYAYWLENYKDWYRIWGTTAIVVLQLETDALMICRCRVVWGSYRAIIVPIIFWLVTLALGFLADWTSAVPEGNIFVGIASQLGLAYWTISVFLNTMLTCMICHRIMWYGKWVQEQLGREHASLYFKVTTMVVESVLPYTVSGIAFLVSYGMGSPTSMTFGCMYVMMMCISPQLLILRVIAGTAWQSDTSIPPRESTIQFDVENTLSRRSVHL